MQSTQPYSNIQSQIGGERHTLLRLGRFSKDLGMIGSRRTGPEANRRGLSFEFRYGDQRPTEAGTSPSEIMKERRRRWSELWLSI
ncbi:hypothetical protein DY000_02045929 [Brassica cretica]|uniref:Uncharacterized protein n=1 Tax=Brassica cretica TaxID=69181 RepID=A0ABQ7EP59_BRACR|nr:hypothetical protein DY000_02045929 [Brassica cretica]